ncbi:hypothetical protein ACWGB8_17740 [Kitasatospora sp. NPDC054939]
MTRDRTKGRAALAAAAGLLLGTAACTSSDAPAGGSPKLSYDGFTATVGATGGNGPCPFGIDLAAALRAAGDERGVTPGSDGGPAVRTHLAAARPASAFPDGASRTPPLPTVPARPAVSEVTCYFTVGSSAFEVQLVAVPVEGPAVNLLLPQLQSADRLSGEQLTAFAAERQAPGTVRLTPGEGRAAIARIPVAGGGDLALSATERAQTLDAKGRALRGEALRKAAEQLVGQLRP